MYVTFAFDPKIVGLGERIKYHAARLIYGNALPYSSINYVWDNRAAIGTILPNAYTDRVGMVVLESGTTRAGEWVDKRCNVYEDYLKAFGTEPPPLSGVAVMTDTDDTGESVVAWYGDIVLEPAEP